MDFLNELKKFGADSLSLAVIRNYQIVETVAVGNDITPHTRFQAASISKMVFTFAVLRLASESRISLYDDVNRYLGRTPLTDRDGNPARVNVRQILSHTAGIGVHGFDGYPVGSVLPTTSQIIAGEPPCNSPKICCEYAPDEHWVYSGGGFIVLQKCVENITETDFADFMERYVLSPIGMEDSTFRQDITGNLAKGYTENSEPVSGGHMLMPEQAAAGLWTTATDMAKFGIHIMNILRGGDGLISKNLAELMTLPQHSDVFDMEGTKCRTGLGCYLKNIGGTPYFGHSGGNIGFVSLSNFSAESGDGCCTLVNSDEAFPLLLKLQEEIFGNLK